MLAKSFGRLTDDLAPNQRGGSRCGLASAETDRLERSAARVARFVLMEACRTNAPSWRGIPTFDPTQLVRLRATEKTLEFAEWQLQAVTLEAVTSEQAARRNSAYGIRTKDASCIRTAERSVNVRLTWQPRGREFGGNLEFAARDNRRRTL